MCRRVNLQETTGLTMVTTRFLNPSSAKLNNLNFHPFEVVSLYRYSELQLQVVENYSFV